MSCVEQRLRTILLRFSLVCCLVCAASAERLAHRGSLLAEGGNLIEDLLATHDSRSLVKAGAVAALAAAAILGGAGAGLGETSSQGAITPNKSPESPSEMGADRLPCSREGTQVGGSVARPDTSEENMHSEYAGFMDGMYQAAFGDLSEDDLVCHAPPALMRETEATVTPAAEERNVSDDCPGTGALEDLLAARRGSKQGVVLDTAGEGQVLEDRLEAALAEEYVEFMGDDYSEIMDRQYQGLMDEFSRTGVVLAPKT